MFTMFTLATIVSGAGVVLILVGLLGGGFTFSGAVVPAVGKIARVLCFAVGGIMLPVGIALAFVPVGPDSVTQATQSLPLASSTDPVAPVTSERSAPDAVRWSTSETNFFNALDAEGIGYHAYGTKQDLADLAWSMCAAFSTGMTLEEASNILIQDIDAETAAAIQVYGVQHLCPENDYIFN